MKKNSKITDVYKPNNKVKVTVVNEPVEDEESGAMYFARTVTIKVKAGFEPSKLTFEEEGSIEKFLEEIDFEDPQMELGLESPQI